MNNFDLIILGLLLVFAGIGAWRGFIREFISAVTWVLACVLAWLFAAQFAALFKNMVSEPELRQVLAFALIFVTVFILGLVVSWLIHKYFPLKRGFRLVNTTLGGLIGALRGAVIVIVVFLAAGLTSFPQRAWWRESMFTPYFERAAVYVSSYIPRDIARHIRYS